MKLCKVVDERWSPRAFSVREVPDETLGRLFEAARWAPSCYNDQPWSFIVGRRGPGDGAGGNDGWSCILDCLVEFNQSWARTAPVLLLAVARAGFARDGSPNRHAWYDTGQAMGNLLAQATHEGLLVHQMAGFDPDRARAAFDIPADHDAVAAAALGYLGDPADLPEGMDEKRPEERERKAADSFVFEGAWGRPFGAS